MRALVGTILFLFLLLTGVFLFSESSDFLAPGPVGDALKAFHTDPRRSWIVIPAIVLLLAADLFLPVPSSVLMTLSGYFLGLLVGALTSFAGAMASALAGFWLCRRFGHGAFWRLVGTNDTCRVQRLFDRYGDWAVLLTRPVPMLCEIVSCVAGLGQMSVRRFAGLSAAATLPLCAVYAWAGQYAGAANAPFVAIFVAATLPAVAFYFTKRKSPG